MRTFSFTASLLLLALAASAIGLEFSNDNLKVVKDLRVTEGSATTFTCEVPNDAQTVIGCQMATPNGALWNVVMGQSVTDENGNSVPGYNGVGHGAPDKVCGIEIVSVSAADLG